MKSEHERKRGTNGYFRTCIFTILFTMKKSVIDTIKKILTKSRFDTQ